MYQDFEETTQILKFEFTVPPKVLLVDDDELVLEKLKMLVSAAGYEVATASSGTEALQTLEQEFTPIVIADRNMPEMDGLALCQRIRQRTTYPGYIYLILLTVHDSETDILAGLDAGADDYLSKRASNAQLIARLRTAKRILALEQSLKNAIEERRRMAMTDALTGAHNRRYFLRHMMRELKRIKRSGGTLSLLVLDIDHFKHVNDRYGHPIGDQVLQRVVERIGSTLPREFDWSARLGGEEFAVVLPQTNLEGAAVVAERIRQSLAGEPVTTSWGKLPVTVSIGVSGLECLQPGQEPTAEMLLELADQCLYASKENGRNRVTVKPALNGS